LSRQANVESLLAKVLAPVEPPAGLAARLTSRLEAISVHAAGELDTWELAAMRDPRNWAGPLWALIGGGAAGLGLVLLGLGQRRRSGKQSD